MNVKLYDKHKTDVDGIAAVLEQHVFMRPVSRIEEIGDDYWCTCGEFVPVVDPIGEWRLHVARAIHNAIQRWPNTWQHELLPSLAMPLKVIAELTSDNGTVEGAAQLANRSLGFH
jgi:hypothetical protein